MLLHTQRIELLNRPVTHTIERLPGAVKVPVVVKMTFDVFCVNVLFEKVILDAFTREPRMRMAAALVGARPPTCTPVLLMTFAI